MKRIAIVVMVLGGVAGMAAADQDLAKSFAQPPASARPWVYWFPLSGNLTKEGITADLEAMQRVGIGGLLYMEVDQGAPQGPADFAGPLWRKLFQHSCREANRLGLQINVNNDAGWCGSGGPWITPDLSMQKVVWSETTVQGPKRVEVALARPPAVRGYYRDIAVLAMPAPAGSARVVNLAGKSSLRIQQFPPQPARFATVEPGSIIPRDKIVDLTGKMAAGGKLTWDAPAGRWLVLRFGHTTTGKDNHPAPATGRGLECDKFSSHAAEVHFNHLVGKLIADNKALAGQDKVLVSTHVDSWEVGSQNWTPRMRDQFRKRCGYDLLGFLPVYTGRIVDSLEMSERFLWDLRQAASDMVAENYAGTLRTLANKHGLRLSIEAYGSPTENLAYAGAADEPMSEFWSWGKFGAAGTCTEMSSAAHTWGKPILGAEAFTATNAEKWQGYPGNIKDLGDWAFCEGVNRFVFHRYAMQPWPSVAPGMSMGPWGLHYERTQTWWEMSRAWHEYLGRCQYLLQQGRFVADVCYLAPEGAPRSFAPPPEAMAGAHIRGGYNFDGCNRQVVLTRMSVKDGRIVLPDGMSYRVLVLPDAETMTPALLAKLKELVDAGAVVFAGQKPVKAPGLTDYPRCDQQVRTLANALWAGGKLKVPPGAAAPAEASETPPPALRYPAAARWIWLPEGNPAAAVPPGKRYFRRLVKVDAPEQLKSARMLMTADNSFQCWINGRPVGSGDDWTRTTVMNVKPALRAGANVIAVEAVNATDTPNPAGLIGALILRYADGRTVELATDKSWQAARTATGNWRTASTGRAPGGKGWVAAREVGPMGIAPWGDIESPTRHHGRTYGQAVVARAYRWLDEHAGGPDFEATVPLRYIHRAIGPIDAYFVANPGMQVVETLASFRVTGKQVELWDPETGSIASMPAYRQAKGRTTIPLRLGPAQSVFVVFRKPQQARTRLVSVKRDDRELLHLSAPGTAPASRGGAESARDVLDLWHGQVWRGGRYELTYADGHVRKVTVAPLPGPQEVAGPWQVSFDPRWGGPKKPVTFDKLQDWSRRSEPGIRYYSGTATYRRTLHVPEQSLAARRRVWLDLGDVKVMARVKVNGKDLGILWKTPYRLEITSALRRGENTLEVQVVNLWINRQIGDEQLPEDSNRNRNGTLKNWPKWLDEGKPSPTGRYTFTSWRLWHKNDRLSPSGLLGPVRLLFAETLTHGPSNPAAPRATVSGAGSKPAVATATSRPAPATGPASGGGLVRPGKVVQVASAAELIRSIGPDRVLRLKAGDYILSRVKNRKPTKWVRWFQTGEPKPVPVPVVRGVKNLWLEAERGGVCRILADGQEARTLCLATCQGVRLAGLTDRGNRPPKPGEAEKRWQQVLKAKGD